MPAAYLALEQTRLRALVAEWLRYEAARIPFTVADTELASETSIGAETPHLDLRLRLDRVDRLNDGSLLVIDYKTGDVSPRLWDLPRPDDVQLPLYAEFGLPAPHQLGGLVFARVRAGEPCFAGRMADARTTLLAGLSSNSGLIKRPLSPADLIGWRGRIEELARDFLRGDAEVNPRDYPRTCEACGLQTLCRVYESRQLFDSDDEGGEEDEGA